MTTYTGWTLAKLRAKVRSLTGRLTEGQLSSSAIDAAINNYYCGVFPELMGLEKKKGFWQFNTAATDTGLYPYASNIILLKPPAYCITADPPLAEDEPWVETEEYPEGEISVEQDQMRIFTEPEKFYGVWPQSSVYARSQPIDCLLWRRNILVAPPPDKIYSIQVQGEFSIVTELTAEGDAPEQDNWGWAIAYAAAIEISIDKGDEAKAEALASPYDYYLNLCDRREVRSMGFKRAVPRF